MSKKNSIKLVFFVLLVLLIIPVSAVASSNGYDTKQFYGADYEDLSDNYIMDTNEVDLSVIGLPKELNLNVLNNEYQNTLKISISVTGLSENWVKNYSKINVELIPMDCININGDNILAYGFSNRNLLMKQQQQKENNLSSPINSYYFTRYVYSRSMGNFNGKLDNVILNLKLDNAISKYVAEDQEKDFIVLITINEVSPILSKKIKVVNNKQQKQTQKTPFPLIGVLAGLCLTPFFVLKRRK